MNVADRLIFLLERLDMTQTELADKVGISKQSLYKYLHRESEPRAEIIARMAVVLNTSADFIVALTDDPLPRDKGIKGDSSVEEDANVISRYKKLSKENRIRVRERIDVLLEEQSTAKQ